MNWFHGAWAVFYKDIKLELRNRYAINMLMMFVLSALLLVVFAVGREALSELRHGEPRSACWSADRPADP